MLETLNTNNQNNGYFEIFYNTSFRIKKYLALLSKLIFLVFNFYIGKNFSEHK